MSWHILAGHKWVAGTLITESINDAEERRFTATVRGYRNWKVFEGTLMPGAVNLIIRTVRAIRNQIDVLGESCEAFMATNEYSHDLPELTDRAEMFEHPISEAFDEWLAVMTQ